MTTVEQAAERDDLLSRRDEPATRGDFAILAADMRAEIAGLRSEIVALQLRLLWRLLGGGGPLPPEAARNTSRPSGKRLSTARSRATSPSASPV